MVYKRNYKRKGYAKRKGSRKGKGRRTGYRKSRSTFNGRPPIAARVQRNSKKIKVIEEVVDTTTATHTKRVRYFNHHFGGYGRQVFISYPTNTLDFIRSAVAKLEFFDIDAMGALTPRNISTVTNFQTKWRFIESSSVMTVANQANTPVNVRMWKTFPKTDTSISPVNAYRNGLSDQVQDFDSSTPANPLARLSDSSEFGKLYSSSDYQEFVLRPGQKKEFTHHNGPFTFDPAYVVDHNLQYQSNLKAMAWLISGVGDFLLEGDEILTGTTNGTKLQVSYVTTHKIQYDGGAAFDRYEYVEFPVDGTFTAETWMPANDHVLFDAPIPPL